MRKIVLFVVMLCFAAVPLWAVDFTGSFEYEVTLGEIVAADGSYGAMDLEIDAEVDEHNTVHAGISGDMGDALEVGDIYLKTVYDPVTVKLGSIDLDSSAFAVTSIESETSAVGMAGDGITAKLEAGGFTIKGGIGVTDGNDADFGGSLAFGKGVLDRIEVSVFKGIELGANTKVVVGNLTLGVGLTRTDSTVFGGGAKYAIGPAWIALGANNDKVFCGDVGAEWDLVGTKITAKYSEAFTFDEASVWWKPGGVKYKGGYRFQDKDVFVNVSADF